MRTDRRTAGQLRPVQITTGCLMTAEGSALIKVGNTHVLCAATVEDLLTLTAIDYGAGRWLERVAPGPRRKAVLIFSLAANLGFLGFFKYYNFLAANLALAMGRPAHSFFLEIVLPLGISFHTFQSMST